MGNKTILKYDYLTAVRGLAIILVVIIHVSQKIENLPIPFFKLCSRGVYGVQMFFIASAVTIFLSYTRRNELKEDNLKLNFFIRRFFRISPMYYFAAIFYCIYYYYNPSYFDQPYNLIKAIPSLIYINGFVPGAVNYIPPGGWSVGVEMAFYCTVPFLFHKITSLKKSIQLFLLLFAITMIIKFAARLIMVYYLHIDFYGPESWTLYFWFPNQVVIFSFGLIIFFLKSDFDFKKRGIGVLIIMAVVVFMLAVFLLKDAYDKYALIPEHIIAGAGLATIIFVMSKTKIRLFDNIVTRFLGKISFSLYLAHFAVINIVESGLQIIENPYVHFFTTLILVLLIGGFISWVTYALIEKRGIALGETLINKRHTIRKVSVVKSA